LRFSKSMSLSDLAFTSIGQWAKTEINLAIWDSLINKYPIKKTAMSTAIKRTRQLFVAIIKDWQIVDV
jgi:hypothetical protein